MTIDYLEGCLTKEEEVEIQEISSELYVHFSSRKPGMSNAALGELFGHVVIWLTSSEVQALVNAVTLFTAFYSVVKKIVEFGKKKAVVKLDFEMNMIVQKQNVIIQANNIKILRPENTEELTEDDYLRLALSVVANEDLPDNVEIIISYNGEFHVETIDQYARRKMKM